MLRVAILLVYKSSNKMPKIKILGVSFKIVFQSTIHFVYVFMLLCYNKTNKLFMTYKIKNGHYNTFQNHIRNEQELYIYLYKPLFMTIQIS